MRRQSGAVLAVALVFGIVSSARADATADAKTVIDKAVKALGGAQKLGKSPATVWKSKGKLVIEGNENEFTSTVTLKDADHFRQEFEGDFGGNHVKGVTILAGDKGWRKFGDNTHEITGDALANQKRIVYLELVAATVLPLTAEGFKITSVANEKVGDKPAVAIKATGPDNKEFTIFFDQVSGLPVKQVARVVSFRGDEFTQETTYSDYKDFAGIKRATKIESKHDGEKFIEQQLEDFKVVDKLDPSAFSEP